jgi:hypothetical protein
MAKVDLPLGMDIGTAPEASWRIGREGLAYHDVVCITFVQIPHIQLKAVIIYTSDA